jgi:hypothetical protein
LWSQWLMFSSFFSNTIVFPASFLCLSMNSLINREAKLQAWRNHLLKKPHRCWSPVHKATTSLLQQAMFIYKLFQYDRHSNNTIRRPNNVRNLMVCQLQKNCVHPDEDDFPRNAGTPCSCICCFRHLVRPSSTRGTILAWRCRCPVTVPWGRRGWCGGSVPGTGLRWGVAFLFLQNKM